MKHHKKDLQLFATKLTEKYLILVMQKQFYSDYICGLKEYKQ